MLLIYRKPRYPKLFLHCRKLARGYGVWHFVEEKRIRRKRKATARKAAAGKGEAVANSEAPAKKEDGTKDTGEHEKTGGPPAKKQSTAVSKELSGNEQPTTDNIRYLAAPAIRCR